MTISIRTSPSLMRHLTDFVWDGTTVAEAIFSGGRLCYPGRQHVEQQLGGPDPYSLEHEARVLEGEMPMAQIRILAGLATDRTAGTFHDLDLLWQAHRSHRIPGEGPSLDRLVASLVAVRALHDASWEPGSDGCFWSGFQDAAAMVVGWLHSVGLPPTQGGLEELFDGAPPACVGLGMVEL